MALTLATSAKAATISVFLTGGYNLNSFDASGTFAMSPVGTADYDVRYYHGCYDFQVAEGCVPTVDLAQANHSNFKLTRQYATDGNGNSSLWLFYKFTDVEFDFYLFETDHVWVADEADAFGLGGSASASRNSYPNGVPFTFEGDVSAVPLPSTAPLLGVALLALGGAGYARRRKAAQAAIS